MSSRQKVVLACLVLVFLVALLVILISATTPGGLFDTSSRQTLNALGEPGVVGRMWAEFAGVVVIAVASLGGIIFVLMRKKGAAA